MPEVDLTLQANIKEYIKELVDGMKANGEFFESYRKGSEKQIENTKEITDQVEKLKETNQDYINQYKKGTNEQENGIKAIKEALRELYEQRKKTDDPKSIKEYNNKIKEAKFELNNLTKEQKKAAIEAEKAAKKQEFSYNKLRSGIYKVTWAVAAAVGAFKIFNGIIKSSDVLSDMFERTIQGAKSGVLAFNTALTSGNWSGFITNMKAAIKAGIEYAKIMDIIGEKRIALGFEEAKAQTRYVELMTIIRSGGKTETERRAAINELIDMEEGLLAKRTELDKKAYDITLKRIAAERGIKTDEVEAYIKDNDTKIKSLERFAKEYEDKQKAINAQYKETYVGMYKSSNAVIIKEQLKALETASPVGAAAKKIIDNLSQITKEERQELLDMYKALEGDRTEFAHRIQRAVRVQDMLNMKDKKEADKAILKDNKEFLKLLEELYKKSQDAQIEMLSGKAKVDAIEKANLTEVDALEKQLKSLGKLTKDQYAQLEILRTSIKKKAVAERLAIDREEYAKIAEGNEKVRDILVKQADDEIELLANTDEEKLQMQIDYYKKIIDQIRIFTAMSGGATDESTKAFVKGLEHSIALAQKELASKPGQEFSIWKLLGIDTRSDEGKKQVEAIKESLGQITDALGEMMQAEIALAEQRTQILDDRLSELESQLDEEKQLQEDGFANNVDLVKKEIAETKLEREKALQEEKKIKEQQFLMDSAMQASSLITATANILKGFSALPIIGQILSIAAIATMFGTFIAAKTKAAQAIKMADGGYVDEYKVVKGKRHSEGGEPLNRHVEIEAGEGLGVFNRGAISYYGDRLPEWVADINAKQIPKFDIKNGTNNIYQMKVERIEKELRDVNEGIKIMNENLLSRQEDHFTGRTRIEKRKNHTRIIHVNR